MGISEYTMVQNRKKHRISSHLIIHCLTSVGVSGVRKRCEQGGARKRASSASEQAKERKGERTDERGNCYHLRNQWQIHYQ